MVKKSKFLQEMNKLSVSVDRKVMRSFIPDNCIVYTCETCNRKKMTFIDDEGFANFDGICMNCH